MTCSRWTRVPASAGVYAWWFREIPSLVPTDGCVVHDGLTLLYVGIAPKAPPQKGKPPTSKHFAVAFAITCAETLKIPSQANASASPLDNSDISLQRVGSGTRMTFADAEAVLSDWMADNAFVCWVVTQRPCKTEEALISSVCLPLNLDQNRSHSFHARLPAERQRRSVP